MVSGSVVEDHGGHSIIPVMGQVPILVGRPIPNLLRPLPGGRDGAVEIWLRAYRSHHTRNAYRHDIGTWFAFCDSYGLDITEAYRGDVDAYRDTLDEADPPLALRTIRRRLAAISSFYTYWVRDDRLRRNPAAHAHRPRVGNAPGSIALDREQTRQLVTYVDALPDIRPAVAVRLLLETGMRVSELCGADVTDLALSSGHRTLTIVRKGGVQAVTVLTPGTAHLVDVYLRGRMDGPLLITNGCKKGAPGRLDRKYVRDLVRRLARDAGLPREVCERMHPHVLRHTAAVLMDRAGVQVQQIQRQLGHADPRTTQTYIEHGQELDASPVYVLAGVLYG